MDIWTYNADEDDDDGEINIASSSDSDDQRPAHKLPAAKRARVKLGLRQIDLLDDIDDLDPDKKEEPELKSDCDSLRCRPDRKPELDEPASLKPSSSRPARAVRLDPALQAEAMRAKAILDRIRRQAEEVAEASASEDDEEVIVTSTAANPAEQNMAGEEIKIMLKIKSAKDQEGQKMRIGVRQPLSKLFTAYQKSGQTAGWLNAESEVTFKFDGERLKGTETPAGLEMEEDDVIDAVW